MGIDNLLEYISVQFPGAFEVCTEDMVHKQTTEIQEHVYPLHDTFQTFLTTQLATYNAYYCRDREIERNKRLKVRHFIYIVIYYK